MTLRPGSARALSPGLPPGCPHGLELAPIVQAARSFILGALVVLGVLSVLGMHGCTPQAAKTVLDISGAICEELAEQDEPEWLKFTCSAVDVAGNVTPFLARVKREDAAEFRARRCPQEGAPAP